MPIRWMAPESIRDNTFSTASDIWSFGMVLWEMVTLGEQPYQGMTNEQVVHCVREGETNGIPRNCPELIAALMNDCWKYDPDNRPNFIGEFFFKIFMVLYVHIFQHEAFFSFLQNSVIAYSNMPMTNSNVIRTLRQRYVVGLREESREAPTSCNTTSPPNTPLCVQTEIRTEMAKRGSLTTGLLSFPMKASACKN